VPTTTSENRRRAARRVSSGRAACRRPPNIHSEDFGLRHLPGVEEVSPPRNKQHGRKHSGAPSTTHKQAPSSSSAILETSHGHGWPAAKPSVTFPARSCVETPSLRHLSGLSGSTCRAVCVGGVVFAKRDRGLGERADNARELLERTTETDLADAADDIGPVLLVLENWQRQHSQD
jgi:hypothetical protein